MHPAERARQQRGSEVTAELRVVRKEFASCHHSWPYKLEEVPKFLENLWTLIQIIYKNSFPTSQRMRSTSNMKIKRLCC
jgi:hypothetical protein